MDNQNIIKIVDKSIAELCRIFKLTPSYFYTENDIVCYFYSLLKEKLSSSLTQDKEGYEHLLFHAEYSTPFRCSMKKNLFVMMDEEARSGKQKKYRRGRYDIVILNPNFIKQNTYDIIKAQNYEDYKSYVVSKYKNQNFEAVMTYCIEFMYSRNPLKYSRGKDKMKSINEFVAKIKQDADKLLALKEFNGFASQVKMLCFIKNSPQEICDYIIATLSQRNEILVCTDYNKTL